MVSEARKARWRGIRKYNKTRRVQKQKRRRRVYELWSTGQYSRHEIALMVGVGYKTVQVDIREINKELEAGSQCFLCGGIIHHLPTRRVLSRSAADHRRLADLLDGGESGGG